MSDGGYGSGGMSCQRRVQNPIMSKTGVSDTKVWPSGRYRGAPDTEVCEVLRCVRYKGVRFREVSDIQNRLEMRKIRYAVKNLLFTIFQHNLYGLGIIWFCRSRR